MDERTNDTEVKRGVYLADGTYLNADAGYANGDLWIWMREAGKTVPQMVEMFADPNRSGRITYVITKDEQQVWEYFTVIMLVQVDFDEYASIRLRRG